MKAVPEHLDRSASRGNREVLVKVESVSKKYCRDLKKSLWYGMADVMSELLPQTESAALNASRKLRCGEFWAVEDVSFQLRRGECLGLIGHNGAGKTTLLKMLNGLLKPDSGRIEIRGRVGALIALGAGFNPILTGRENIYVNGAVLGLDKSEINKKIDDIIDFAEIGDFIDAPVQSYSSGMQVRLGFAVATALDPDVLLLDEVLAVGDAAFRFKCYNRIASLMENAAVILVTHNMEHVGEICSHALMLGRGKVLMAGSPQECIQNYDKLLCIGPNAAASFLKMHESMGAFKMNTPADISHGDDLYLHMCVDSIMDVPNCVVRVSFYNQFGKISAEHLASMDSPSGGLVKGLNPFLVRIPSVCLRSGRYFMDVNIHQKGSLLNLVWSHRSHSLMIQSGPTGYADYLIA